MGAQQHQLQALTVTGEEKSVMDWSDFKTIVFLTVLCGGILFVLFMTGVSDSLFTQELMGPVAK